MKLKKSKKKILNDKKAIEKIMSLYWFIILIIVAFGVFAMVYNFYNYPYDIREIESEFLTNKISDCISSSGKINSYVFEENFTEDFLNICSLNLNVEDFQLWKENPQYYVNVGFYNEGNLNLEIEEGNKNLISSCAETEKEIEDEKLAKCLDREFLSSYQDEIYLIKVLSVVRKTEKNVRQ